MSEAEESGERNRLDKWLWCARFYKTRSLAARSIAGGKVQLNGERVKPAHAVRIGDAISVVLQGVVAEFGVISLPRQRGSASVAQTNYVETTASAERRARIRQQQRLAGLSRPHSDEKPDKRQRRALLKLQRGQE